MSPNEWLRERGFAVHETSATHPELGVVRHRSDGSWQYDTTLCGFSYTSTAATPEAVLREIAEQMTLVVTAPASVDAPQIIERGVIATTIYLAAINRILGNPTTAVTSVRPDLLPPQPPSEGGGVHPVYATTYLRRVR